MWPVGELTRGAHSRPAMTEAPVALPALTGLNADLLHLILSHADGLAVVRAGATCKQLKALATTDRLWREICVKRWPSTARLRAQPLDHRTFYFQRIRSFRNPRSMPPEVDVNTVTLMIDGRALGPFSEVLYFADAEIEEIQRGDGNTESYVWDVPALCELFPPLDTTADFKWDSTDVDARFLRDDGKFAQQDRGMHNWFADTSESGHKSLSFMRTLELHPHAEWFSRRAELFFDIHFELGEDGKVRAWCSMQPDPDGFVQLAAPSFGFVLALMEWK